MAENPLFENFLKEGGIKNKVAPEVGAVGSIFAPQAQYDRYMDPKLGYDVSRDNEDYYGENQGVFEKIAYAVPTFVGNTAINIVGNLSAIPVGIVSAIYNQDASKLIDNSYTQALDNMSDGLADKFKFYRTNEETENSVLGNMFGTGAANFWLNDFLNGASFAIGAIASEAIASAATAATFGGAGVAQAGLTARLISRAGKLFKAADKAADAAGAFKYADDAVKLGQEATEQALKATARAQGLTSLGTLGRQLTFGTAYEASVEARHHMRELKESLTEQALAAQGGGELTSDQLQAIDDQTKSSGTGVFLANMALLSISNAAQFNHFTYGVKNLIGKNAGKEVIKGLEKGAFKEAVDETGKTILKPAFETWGKLRKTWDVVKLAKNPLTEGLEESLQSVINNGYSEYSMNKLNPYSQKESADLMESFGDAFAKQFDLGNKEGWKEFMIGAVLGGVGIPMYAAKGVDAEGKTKYGFTLMGGVAQDIKDRKYEREQTRQYAKYYNETASKSPLDSVNIVRNTVRSGIETNSISKQYDEHIQQGNFKEAKDSQEDMGFSFIKAAFDTGRFDTRVEGIANDVMEMDNEEFAKQFGYDNLTDEELQSRKESVVKTYQKLAGDVRSSLKLVDSAMPNVNESLRTAIAHSLFKDRRIDDRIQSIVNRVNEIGGFGYKPEKLTDIVKMFANIYAFQPEEGQLVNKKALDDNIKLQELAQEYEKLTTPDPNLTVEESIARNKKAEKIKSDIEGIIKKYPSMAESTNTIDATKNINEYTKFLNALNKVKDAPGINKDELNTIASDLNKLFADKIRYTALHNYLFTKEGQTKYDNIEQALKELFEESIGKSNEELASDPIFSQKMKLVMEGMGLPASLIEKGKKLNLGILKDRGELEKQAAIDKAKNKEQKKKEKDTKDAKNKTTEASSKIKFRKESVESAELEQLFSIIDEIVKAIDFDNINNSKDIEELKNTKKELEDLKLKLKEELAKGNKESASIKDVIDQIDNANKGIDIFLSNYGKSKIISDVAEKAYRHGFENLNRSFFVPDNATPEEKAFFEDLAKQLTSFTQDQFDNAIQAKALEVRRVSPPNAGKQYELRKGFFYTVPQYISLLYVNGKLAGSIENPQQYMFAVENSNTLIPIDWFTDVENPSELFLSQISVFNGEYVSGNKLTDNAKVMVTQARAVINFYEQETKNNETIGFDKLNEYFNLSKGASKTDGISRSLEEVFFSGKMRLPLAQINGEEIEGIVLIKSIGGSLGFYILDATGTETPIPVDHPIYKELQKVKSKYSPFLKYGSYVIFNPIQNKFYPADLPRTETWGEGSNQVLSLLNALSSVDISEDNYEDLLEGIAADKNGNYPVEIPGTGTVLVKLGKTTKGKSIVSARINFSFSEQANTPGGKLFIPTRPTNDKQLFPFGEIDIVLDKTVNLETGKTTVKLTLQFPEKSTTNKAGFIDFYLDSDNFVMEGDKVVGFKPNLDGEFTLFPSTLNTLTDTKGRGIKAIESVTCKSMADLFKHINENRLTYAKKTNLGGLENCEINIKEENQEKSGFKLIDGNPLNLTVKENPDGAIKILPKNTAALSKVSKKEVKKESTKKAPVTKPAAMKVEEPVVETETKTPTDSRTTSININGEIFDIGLTELENLVNALSLTDTDTLSRTELNNYMNALKFLTKFKDLKEYVVNYLSAIVESQSKELAPITTYVIGKIFPMTPKTNGVSNKIIKDSFDQVKNALLTSLQTELDTLKATPQQNPISDVERKKQEELDKQTPVKNENITINDGQPTEEVKPNTTETKAQRGDRLKERRLKAQQQNENKDDSDPNAAPFSLFNEDEVEKSTITYEEAVRNIAELLPDTIDIRDINEVIGKLSANGVPAGVFFNRIVYLSKNFRNKGTEYHEAFHAVFRLLFNDQEIANVLNYAANKYGVPSIEQLLDLRDKSADYANLTQEEITQLWYEEKLADAFAKYATTKNVKKDPTGGFFAKMWQLIKEFFNISRSTDDSVEKYFDNILNKAYKNRQVRTTQFPTLVNLSTAAFELYKNNDRVNITSSQSQRITAQTLKELLVMSNRMGVDLKDINDELIIDAFKEVINSKYDPDLYFDYIKDKPAHQQEAIEDKIATFYETLYYIDENTGDWTEHDKNHSVVVSEIRKKLQYYEEIVNETWDVNENEEETPDQLSSIESYKIGGFSSAPAFMRFFMSTVELKDDVFGIGVDIDSLDAAEQDFFITTADGYKIYNGVLSRVADLRKSEILPALMSVNNNKNIEAFRQKLLTEILKEYYLNTGRRHMVAGASYMEYDPDVHTHEELSKTALYNMFLRTFDKARINPQTTYVDQKSSGKKAGTSISIGRANLRGVDQKQLEQWDINWSKKKVNFKNKEDIRAVLNYIKDALFSTEVSSFEDLNKLIVTVKNEFAKLGIELHEDYIKTSYLLARKRTYNKKAKEGDEFAKSALKLLLTVPASLKSITSEMLNGMSNAANNLTDENRLNLFGNIATITNEEGEQDDITQANTRYRQMAEGNAFFDENVVEANYRNADGETVYSFVEKSYITTFTKQAKNIFTEVFDAIDNEDISQEEASDMLLEKMIEAEFLTSDDYYLAKSRIRLLTKNFLFKNKKDRDIFLNNLDISFIDGLVDRPLKKEKGQINTDVSKGKGFDRRASTFGSMSVRDKLLYNIFNFFNNKSVVDEETVGTKKVETIPVFSQSIGVQSDKNTHFLIDFISKNYVSINNYTNEFYESVYNLIMGEYTRIMELQDESKDLFESRTTGKTAAWIAKSNLVNGYEDFHYIRKNGVDWYIVDGQVKGVDRDGQVVENTIGLNLNNFRGLQIYNFNPNRYRLTNPGLADQLEALRNGAIEKLTPPSLQDSKAMIKEIMDFQYQRFVKVLVSSNVNALEEIVDDNGQVRVVQKQQLLPSQLFSSVKVIVGKQKRAVKELQETQLKNFFFNYYLNNMGFSQMLRGDKYLSVNDPVNGVKRESKNNASGPNMGVGNTKVAIIEESKQVMDELQRTGVKVDPNKAIERADAQGISRMSWHSTYLNALGKVDIRIKQIYRKYEKTGDISESDMSYLESKGALMQTLKLVYSADKYLKMSVTFLNRNDVSTILPENKNLYRTLVDAKHAAEDNNGMLPTNYFDDTTLESLGLVAGATYSDIVEKITGLFIPLAGREKLHALLNEMDLKDIDFTIYKSGSKTVNKDVGYFHNDQWVLHPSEFTNSNMREQVVTENLKDEGIDGTQKNQLITSEQYSNAESTFNDKRVKVEDLVQAHDTHLANRIKLQYDRLQRMIIDNNNKAVWDYLLDQFIEDLISSGKNPLVLEYAKSIKNNQGFTTSPQYNLNHPFVETLFQQTFLSFASKNSTKSKANLIKFTLVSDEGINMVRDTVYMVDKALVELGDNILNTKLNKDGSVSSLTEEEQQFVDENLNLAYYNNNYEMAYAAWRDNNVYERILDKSELIRYSQGRLEPSGEITQSRLQHRVLGPDGKYYSECIVSEWFLKKYGLKVGDKIPDRLLKMLGVRIPTQDKHSMVTLKIVGFKEGLHGNDIHVPMEVLYLSGADFDIDALYTRIIAKLKNEKKFFGDYVKAASYGDALELAFEEFADDIKSSKIYKKNLRIALQNSDVVKAYNAVTNELGKRFEAINDRIIEEKNSNYAESLAVGQLINLNDYQYRIENITDTEVTLIDMDTNVSTTYDINTFNSMFSENTETQFEKVNRESNELFAELPEVIQKKYKTRRDLFAEFGNSVFNKFISDLTLTQRLLENELYAENPQLQQFANSLMSISNEFGIPSAKYITSVFDAYNETLYDVIIPNAFRQASGINPDIEEFERKYRRTITRNMEAYNEGKIQNIEPLTISEANNILLEVEMGLVHNSGNKEIAGTPATLSPLREIEKELSQAGVLTDSEHYGEDSPLDHYSFTDSIEQGKRGIGIVAVSNILAQLLYKNNISIRKAGDKYVIDPIFNSKTGFVDNQTALDEILNDEGIRKNDIKSTILSAMTDNAKEVLAGVFNLNGTTLGAFNALLDMGVSLRKSVFFSRQPVLQALSASKVNDRSVILSATDIKTKKRKQKGQFTNEEDRLFSEVLLDAAPRTPFPDNTSPSDFLTEENLKNAILFETHMNDISKLIQYNVSFSLGGEVYGIDPNNETESFELMKAAYNMIQIGSYREYKKLKKIQDYLFHMTKVLSLSKGFPSSFNDIQDIKDSLLKLGIKVSEGDPSNLNSYQLSYVEEYERDRNNYPLTNILEMIDGSNLIRTNIQAMYAVSDISKEFFIMNTDTGLKIYSSIMKSLGPLFGNYSKEEAAKIYPTVLSALTLAAYRKQISDGTVTSSIKMTTQTGNPYLSKMFDLSPLFDVAGNKRLLEKARRSNEADVNLLLKTLNYTTTSYDGVEGSALENRVVGRFVGDSISKRNPEYASELIDAYTRLISNPETKELALAIFNQIVLRDGMMFTRDSLIRHIDPSLMKQLLSTMDDLHENLLELEGITDQEERNEYFIGLFGMEEIAFLDNIQKLILQSTQFSNTLKRLDGKALRSVQKSHFSNLDDILEEATKKKQEEENAEEQEEKRDMASLIRSYAEDVEKDKRLNRKESSNTALYPYTNKDAGKILLSEEEVSTYTSNEAPIRIMTKNEKDSKETYFVLDIFSGLNLPEAAEVKGKIVNQNIKTIKSAGLANIGSSIDEESGAIHRHLILSPIIKSDGKIYKLLKFVSAKKINGKNPSIIWNPVSNISQLPDGVIRFAEQKIMDAEMALDYKQEFIFTPEEIDELREQYSDDKLIDTYNKRFYKHVNQDMLPIGLKAVYIEVDSLGTKEVSTIAGTVQQWEYLKKNKPASTKKIEEVPDFPTNTTTTEVDPGRALKAGEVEEYKPNTSENPFKCNE